jgi:hypothetical protein
MGVDIGYLGLTRMNMVFLFIKGPEDGRLIVWWFGIKSGLDARMAYIEQLNVILMPKLVRGHSSVANFEREKDHSQVHYSLCWASLEREIKWVGPTPPVVKQLQLFSRKQIHSLRC